MSKHNDLHLDDVANTFDIPPGDVDAVVSRARSRTQRRRALMATVTTIAVVTGAVSFIGTRGDDGDDDSTNVATEIVGDAKLGDDQFTWTSTESAKGLAWAPAVGGSGQLYALSTGPGERMGDTVRQNGHVYRSADGVDWQSVSRLSSDMFLSDLAPASERLYAVGTGPATAVAGKPTSAKASDLIAGWSDDGGETWNKAVLPFDMRAVAAKSINTFVMDTEVASSPKGTLAVAAVRTNLDVPALLPDDAKAPNGWVTTADGVDVLGPRKTTSVCPAGTTAEKGGPRRVETDTKPGEVGPTYCFNENADDRSPESTTIVTPQEAQGVTATYTWDQLGVSGDVLRAARGELIGFFAEPGSTDFTRLDMGAVQVGSPLFAIAAEDGFDIIKSSAPSPKGERSHMSVLHSSDGRTFAPVASDPSMAFASYAGLLGSTPVVFGGTEDGKPVMLRRGAASWTATDLSGLVTHPSDTMVYMGSAGVGPAGAAVSVMIAPMETKDGRTEPRAEQPVTRLLTTRDGVTWHDQSIDDLAGRKTGGVGMIAVTGDRLVVTALLPKTDDKAEVAPRLTLIGTPR
jgi:hypothetical protein